MCSQTSKLPKWVPLEPGVHDLRFSASRWNGSGTSFRRCVDLTAGEVLVAVCEPVQPPVFYAKSPSADLWHLGVTVTGPGVVGPARFRDLPGEPAPAAAKIPLPRRRLRRRARA